MIRSMFFTAVILAFVAPANADITFVLVTPRHSVRSGATIAIDLVALNSASEDVAFDAPPTLSGALSFGSETQQVQLTAGQAAPAAVPAGGFAYRRYRMVVPDHAIGETILHVDMKGVIYAVLKVDPAVAADAGANVPIENQSRAASLYRRMVAGRLLPHNSIYFIAGGDAPAAKFQLSLKYRVFTFARQPTRTRPTLQLGFTQRSLWDIGGDSSPFYDTSYIPEVFMEWLDPVNGQSAFRRLGWQAGYRHESNGRDAAASRSYNVIYVRPMFGLGNPDRWHMTFFPEVWAYSGSHDRSPDIERYRGDGLVRFLLGRGGGAWLFATMRLGRNLEAPSYQIDFSFPMRSRFIDFESFFVIQYFDGYGESLLTYDQKSRTVRAGISLIRP